MAQVTPMMPVTRLNFDYIDGTGDTYDTDFIDDTDDANATINAVDTGSTVDTHGTYGADGIADADGIAGAAAIDDNGDIYNIDTNI